MRAGRPLPVRRRLSRITKPLLAGLAVIAALGIAAGLSPLVGTQSPWEMQRTSYARRTGTFAHPLLNESSGVAASRREPGILWTLNDSGNDSWIFATDTLGRDLGALKVTGAENRDWEAIALGPCGTRDCLYIADTGDNTQNLRSARIYRIPEPPVPARGPRTARVKALEFRYPKASPDVEAIFVTADGAIHLITKGSGRRPLVYRIDPEAWDRDDMATARANGRLPIDTGSLGNRVTDAALSPSGERVAVRTYLAIYLFNLKPDGTLAPLGVACDAAGLQFQGEGISWLDDRVLVLTSEGGFGSPGTIVLLECGGRR
ncbi:MAG: hypothetical protein ACREM9_10725 [Gemmatimonadales bacterium]